MNILITGAAGFMGFNLSMYLLENTDSNIIGIDNMDDQFYLNNHGNHVRDWTYVKDVCKIITRLIKIKSKENHKIYNICSNKPVHLRNVMKQIDKLTNKRPKIIERSLQQADIIKTHGDNSLIKKFTGIKKFTSTEEGIKKTVEWYIKNNL